MLNYIGQLGPLLGVHLYPDADQPYYIKGMSVCAGFMVAVGILAFGLRKVLQRENRSVAATNDISEDGEDEGLVARDLRSSTRRAERFVFML